MPMTVSQLMNELRKVPNHGANIQVRSTAAAGVANIGTVTQTSPATQTHPPHVGAEFGKNGPAAGAGVVLLSE